MRVLFSLSLREQWICEKKKPAELLSFFMLMFWPEHNREIKNKWRHVTFILSNFKSRDFYYLKYCYNQAINQSLLLDNKEESNDEYHWSTIYCTINIKLWQLPVWRLKQILSLVLQQVRNEGNPDDVFVNKYKMSFWNSSK